MVRDVALRLYRRGAQIAEKAGIMLADTKFEFGLALDWAHGRPAKPNPSDSPQASCS